MANKATGRLFLYVSVCVALIDALFVYINYHFSEQNFKQNMKAESESLYHNYQTLLSQNYSNLLTIATFISSDPKVQQFFYNGKLAVEKEGGGAGGTQAQFYRDELYGLVGEKWAAVQKKFSARQLHFHLGPGSTSFLRVHKPEKFGDNMDNIRFTIVDTNEKATAVTGFETGRVYSGLRGVVPITAIDSKSNSPVHVGALEAGTSFDVILKILHDTSNYAAGVLLTKQHIAESMWPPAIERKFGGQNTDCECVIEAASDDSFKSIIEAGKNKGIRFRDGGHNLVEVSGSMFLISHFPLRDYLGSLDANREDVGAVVFWKNVDESLSALRTGQLYSLLYGIIGFVLVELLFFTAFGFGTVRLKELISKKTQELAVNQERLTEAQSMAKVGNWEWDIPTGKLWWSDQVYKLFQVDPETVQPTDELCMSFVHHDDKRHVKNAVNKALVTQEGYSIEYRIVLNSGQEIQVLEHAHVELDDVGISAVLKGTIQDISSLKHAEQRLADVIWATGVGIWEWTIENDGLVVNDRWANMAGYSVGELSPLSFANWEMLICPEDLAQFRQQLLSLVDEPMNAFSIEVKVRHRDGGWIWVLVKGRCVQCCQDGKATVVSGSCTDITLRKKDELKIQRLATTDVLTGLFNRSVFNQRLSDMVQLADRTEQSFCLMMIDLDEFKPVNDKYGHPVGDALLRMIARDLKQSCRESDLVARLGGDEFAIILSSTSDQEGSKAFAERLLESLSRTREIEGHAIQVSASIGCGMYGPNTMTIDELVKISDKAMYDAKRSGKNAVRCCC